MVKRTVTIIVVAFILAAAGCKGDTPTPQPPSPTPLYVPPPTSTPVPTTPPAPTPVPTPVPPSPTPTQEPSHYLGVEHQGGVLGEAWSLVDVRYGSHADRLRVVWEVAEAGEHVPWFKVVEVDNSASPFPTGHDPSWGAARIDLIVSDLYAYDFPLGERLPLVPPDDPLVTRIGHYPTFSDSELGFSIGLKSPAAYEVRELTDPVRIVIDVLYSK